jgi:hypothetical protein
MPICFCKKDLHVAYQSPLFEKRELGGLDTLFYTRRK